MADRDDLDDLDPELEAKFDAFLDRKLEARAKQRERNAPPKDFGDVLDRIGDEVRGILEEEFGLERKSERRRGDDPPSRGGGGGDGKREGGGKRSAAERFWGLGAEERSA